MDYSVLGPTGVRVSKVCLGSATFGVAPDAPEAERVVHAALDLGINFSTPPTFTGQRRPSTGRARHRPPNGKPAPAENAIRAGEGPCPAAHGQPPAPAVKAVAEPSDNLAPTG
jgi:1-deoxyxylulose-5-phosphate synthase